MSTHAMIYAKQKDGTIRGIYLHSDGYLSYAGRMLLRHYTEDAKIQKLIALGDISSLGENPEADELIATFGFAGQLYPVHGRMPEDIPATWKKLSVKERTRLKNEHFSGKGTTAYARDRGEQCHVTIRNSEASLKKSRCDPFAYQYYWDGSSWFYRVHPYDFEILTEEECSIDAPHG